MTEIRYVFPLPEIERTINGETYREDRRITDIEDTIAKAGGSFSMEQHIRGLQDIFTSDPQLNVFEGGCGESKVLGEIKQLGAKIGKEIHTVGATYDWKHIDGAEVAGVDTLIVGDLKKYFANEDNLAQEAGKYHFILDFYGAAYQDLLLIRGQQVEGGNVIPIYSKLLKPHGSALLTFAHFHPEWTRSFGPGPAQQLEAFLTAQELSIIQKFGATVLISKIQ